MRGVDPLNARKDVDFMREVWGVWGGFFFFRVLDSVKLDLRSIKMIDDR